MVNPGEIRDDPSWAELYRSVLRLGPILEQPVSGCDATEGRRLHAEFCEWLRDYLLQSGRADADSLLQQELAAAIEGENWQALWSLVAHQTITLSPSRAR